MSTATAPKTFTELQTDFVGRVRGQSSNTTTATIAKRYLNIALQDLHINPGNKFVWAERRGVLITHAPYSTGTVTVTAAARTTVTGSSTLWNTAVTGFGYNNARAGGKMKFNGVSEIYRVNTVGGDTSITLDNLYTGDALSAADYTYFEDEYALASDFLRFVDLQMFSTDLEIPLVGAQDFRRWYGRNDVAGKPRVASQIQLSFSGNATPRHRVVLHPYPDAAYSIPYWYVTSNLAVTAAGVEQEFMTDDTDEPIVPLKFRQCIVLHALYNYYRDLKDDSRSQEAKAEYVDLATRATGDTQVGQQRARLVVANKGKVIGRQRYSIDSRFDEIRDRRG